MNEKWKQQRFLIIWSTFISIFFFLFFFLFVKFFFRSLPKLSSQDEEGGAGLGFGGTHTHFEPIPHDHDFCERVVINVR